MRRPTPLARTVDLGPVRNASDADVAARFHPAYGPGIGRLPSGSPVIHGLPFALGDAAGRRWILLDGPITVDLRGTGPATHLVVAHFCDVWRDDDGRRP